MLLACTPLNSMHEFSVVLAFLGETGLQIQTYTHTVYVRMSQATSADLWVQKMECYNYFSHVLEYFRSCQTHPIYRCGLGWAWPLAQHRAWPRIKTEAWPAQNSSPECRPGPGPSLTQHASPELRSASPRPGPRPGPEESRQGPIGAIRSFFRSSVEGCMTAQRPLVKARNTIQRGLIGAIRSSFRPSCGSPKSIGPARWLTDFEPQLLHRTELRRACPLLKNAVIWSRCCFAVISPSPFSLVSCRKAKGGQTEAAQLC
jgi:hypothetical protein